MKNVKKLIIAFFVLAAFIGIFLIIILLHNQQPASILTIEDLRSLPYLAYTSDKADIIQLGVTKYISGLAYEGYNLIGADLMDMEGNIVHSWQGKELVVLLDRGDIIAGYGGNNSIIGKYGWNSDVIWETDLMSDHDITVTDEDTILAISREAHKYNNRNVEFNIIVELSSDGKEISRWSTYDNLDYLKRYHAPSALDKPSDVYIETWEKGNSRRYGGDYDYYHINSLQVLPETLIGKTDKRFQKGNWLISLAFFDLIVILDKKTKKIVWTWGPGEIELQHSPRMLNSGNILIFDNGKNRKYSRVIELDPDKKKIVWEYKTDPPEAFYTETSGFSQRLPNGNTLISESNKGRAFEVTKNGDIVWEWYNPKINKEGKRETFYRMSRISKEKVYNLLNKR